MTGRLLPPRVHPGESGGSINAALRSVRQAAGVSLDALAVRTNFSKPYLGNVEAGRRRVTVEIAEAYDVALGTGGLLARLLAGEPDVPVGRAAELAELHRCTADLADGRGRVVWVEGEPGIGKSLLLRAGLSRPAPGIRSLWAAADQSLARFPLWVLLEPLRAGAPDPELAEISTLLSGGSVEVAPSDAVVAAAERLIMLVERWCAASPVLLVLDDMQWADEVSLSVWGRLRRLVGQLPLLLAGACRPVPRRPEVAALRRSVDEPDGVVLPLGPLSGDVVTQLTGRLAGAPAGPRLRAAADQAGGNPLYLRELVDALLRENRIPVADGHAELTGAEEVPPSLAAAIGTRLDFVPERTRAVLRMAAVLGPEPSVAELAAVTGRPASELAEVLDEAIAAGVLTGASDRMAFRHGLIRAALYEQAPPALRVALHRQAARALAQAGTGVEAVAEHLLAGGDDVVGTEGWVVDWLCDGAAAALVARAPRAALDLLDRVPEPDRARLAGYRIAVLSVLGRDDEVLRTGPAALAAATDTEAVGRIAWTLAYSLGRTGRRPDGRAVLDRTLRGHELDPVWRARLHSCDAVLAHSHTVAGQAVAEAERAGDRFALGYALHAQAAAYQHDRPDEEAALASIDRALAVIGDRPETTDLKALLLSNRMVGLLNLGRLAETTAAMGEALEAAERAGTVPRLNSVRINAAGTYFDWGRWDDALAELAALADVPCSDVEQIIRRHGTAALIALHRDDHATLAAHLAALRDRPEACTPMIGRLRIAEALALEAAGRPAEAAEAVLVAALRPGTTPLAPELVHDCQMFAPDIVRLALAARRRPEAQAYTRAAADLARPGVPEAVAGAQHCQGLLDADPEQIRAAIDGYGKIGFAFARANAQENLAELLARRGDLDRAQIAYDAASHTYAQLEATWDLRRAAARLRPLGLRRSPSRVRRRPASGWEALTPTELKVATLVAAGLSNPDIAARLHVSRRTVETHVGHILTKLAGRSRMDIALAQPNPDPDQ